MIFFVALDDTDNKDSRGTGFKSRELGKLIHKKILGEVESISRHQLFVHDKIAENANVFLKGYTGEKIGVIGALAAIGLRNLSTI